MKLNGYKIQMEAHLKFFLNYKSNTCSTQGTCRTGKDKGKHQRITHNFTNQEGTGSISMSSVFFVCMHTQTHSTYFFLNKNSILTVHTFL